MPNDNIFMNDMPATPWNSGSRQLDGFLGTLMAQPSSFTMIGEQSSRLLREYNLKLIEKMGYMTRRQLKQKDIVDLRAILPLKGTMEWQAPQPMLNAEDKLYSVEEYYYAYIPCFAEGAYHVNGGRYIYWKLQDLDLEQHRMLVWLQDYIYYNDGCGWQPGVCGTLGWKFADPLHEKDLAVQEHRRMRAELGHGDNEGDVPDYAAMYGLLDPVDDMHWGPDDRMAWETVVRPYSKAAGSVVRQKSGLDNLDSLGHMFTTYTIKVNRILSEHKKAARASRQASKAEHEKYLAEKKKALDEQGPEAAKKIKERRVRTIGEITITSRSVPKPGRRAAADYKKPAWKTRGHLRKLPSGKRVYVKESVHRRKALLTSENAALQPEAPTPVTMRITDVGTARGGGYEQALGLAKKSKA